MQAFHFEFCDPKLKPALPAKARQMSRRRLKIWIKHRIKKLLEVEMKPFIGKPTEEVRDAMAETAFKVLNKISSTGNLRMSE